ncbi:MAG: 5'-methylthioadenosine/S-adenosylhomocysteine nucleosidase [Actinomycetaceae bacterium]|nr:5'-methylthioadenosine/S-adenosylhomocysteine nucleosidase [Actinomycetaceae bacterium]
MDTTRTAQTTPNHSHNPLECAISEVNHRFLDDEVTIIACAMELEAEPFTTRLTDPTTVSVGPNRWTLGTVGGTPVCVLVTGIGLTNAAAAVARAHLILDSRIRAYICAGTCGGLASHTRVRDIIIGTEFVYSRADATAFGYAPGQIPGEPAAHRADRTLSDLAMTLENTGDDGRRVLVGQVASSDAFITTDTVESMREVFPLAIGADMESAAAAHVCARCEVPFISVRGVSDLCGPQAGQDFHIDAEEAAEASVEGVLALLNT